MNKEDLREKVIKMLKQLRNRRSIFLAYGFMKRLLRMESKETNYEH